MTQITAQSELGPPTGMPRRRRSLMSRMAGQVLSRWGARLGAAWVVVMLFAAVFAPFLANTHPIAIKTDAGWSSPLLEHLTPGDVLLLVAFFTLLVLAPIGRLSLRARSLIFLAVLAFASPIALTQVTPPTTIVYSQYREALAEGEIDTAIYAPIRFSPEDRLRDQPELRLTGPTLEHPMGVTSFGSDLAANMIYATRIALSIGFISTGIAIAIGIFVGGLMGYFSGWVDLLGMRLVEIFSAVPTLFLLLAFVAAFGANLYMMMVIIGLTSWVGYAVFIRAEFLKLRQQDFVQAAIAAGLPLRSILFRHMLPNGVAPVLVSASFGVAGAILAESTLSFLGIGLPGEASWGGLLNQALGSGGSFFWWIAVYPGLAIFLTVFAYNLVGEALRDAIDPKNTQ